MSFTGTAVWIAFRRRRPCFRLVIRLDTCLQNNGKTQAILLPADLHTRAIDLSVASSVLHHRLGAMFATNALGGRF
jgi:hypothetical protein